MPDPMPLWMCILIGSVAAGLDWSAVGPNRLRDRVASILYIPTFMGMFSAVGLAPWIAATLAGAAIEWRVAAVIVGFVMIFHWIGAMAPPLRQLGNWGRVDFPSAGGGRPGGGAAAARSAKAGAAVAATKSHINMSLVMHSAGVAIALQLVMPGSRYAALLAWIASTLTHAATVAGVTIGGLLGFK